MREAIAVIDKTGRGHAICSALIETNPNLYVYYIPGTGGVFDQRIIPVSSISIDQPEKIRKYCLANDISLVVVSHIDALKSGVADILRKSGILVMGPSAEAVQIESSKWFCKSICDEAGIATPDAKLYEDRTTFINFLMVRPAKPIIVKADWLTCNGNGAFVVEPKATVAEVLHQIDRLIAQNPGSPFRLLVETYLEGIDYSAHYLVNDRSVIELPSSQDFKKSHDGDQGQNCDGMASISPHPRETAELQRTIRSEILNPMLACLRTRGIRYNGPIYLGLRIDESGQPHLIEVNARMGDSESEVIFPRVIENLSAVFSQIANEMTEDRAILYKPDVALALSVVTGPTNIISYSSDNFEADWPNCNQGRKREITYSPKQIAKGGLIFWANVDRDIDGTLLTRTGRIAHVVGLGPSLHSARRNAYASLRSVMFEGMRWRSDIGMTTPLHNLRSLNIPSKEDGKVCTNSKTLKFN